MLQLSLHTWKIKHFLAATAAVCSVCMWQKENFLREKASTNVFLSFILVNWKTSNENPWILFNFDVYTLNVCKVITTATFMMMENVCKKPLSLQDRFYDDKKNYDKKKQERNRRKVKKRESEMEMKERNEDENKDLEFLKRIIMI